MLPQMFVSVTAIDDVLGKVEKSSLSQQTLMELLIQNTEEKANVCRDEASPAEATKWYGIISDKREQVTHLLWGYKSLRGSIQLEWLPLRVVSVQLNNNGFVGTVCLTELPESLLRLSLSDNKFQGAVDLRRLPNRLELLQLELNGFSGETDFTQLPVSLKLLNVSSTKLSGTFVERSGIHIDVFNSLVDVCTAGSKDA
uniref:Leucine-rich repeat protein n=1 Tax=Paramoeba aestuarina TaxID=180227 RepID=A0A7S4KL04_9EUKA|mmetsp:Transcript_20516/g.32045  ORF Transcript_20516/g.32045 Transcript_20516/m.32045 type:complete len:199 (+) Transcript_20516:94-690(+)